MGTAIREFLGWMIMLLGLVLVGIVLKMALDRQVIEAMALSLPAAIIFRSGVGLVRMSAASRIAMKLNRGKTEP